MAAELRREIWRLFWLLAVCLLVLAVFHNSIVTPETRGAALLGFATVLSVAIGYELTVRNLSMNLVLFIVSMIPVLTGTGYLVWKHFFTPPEPHGPLVVAGEPSPPLACREKPGPDDLVMAFGTNRVIGRGRGPFSPIQATDCSTIKLIERDGGLIVEAFGFDWNNDVAYGIRDNRLDTVFVPGLHARRPDRSSFVLLDRFDQEVVYVRYLNRNAVRIRGRFLCGENPQVVIRDEHTLVGGLRIGGAMFGQRPTRGHVCASMNPGDPYGIHIKGD